MLWLLEAFQPQRIRRRLEEIRSRPASIVFDSPEHMPQEASAPHAGLPGSKHHADVKSTGALAGWELILVAGAHGLKTLACRARDL